MTQRRFELRWARTWSDRSHDFSAFEGELLVGTVIDREYDSDFPDPNNCWLTGNRQAIETGIADDRDAACLQVERNYRVFRQRIGGA